MCVCVCACVCVYVCVCSTGYMVAVGIRVYHRLCAVSSCGLCFLNEAGE